MSAPVLCRQCTRAVEEARRSYATPVCFACLPPPAHLPIAWTKEQRRYIERLAAAVAECMARELERVRAARGHLDGDMRAIEVARALADDPAELVARAEAIAKEKP